MGASATYYDILRVSRRAAPEGVRTAYRKLAQKYHPAKLPGNADAVRIMAMLDEAYGVLSDAERRAHYDRRIEDEGLQRPRQRRTATAHVPTAAWPWYLLFATIAFAAATVGTVFTRRSCRAWRLRWPRGRRPTRRPRRRRPRRWPFRSSATDGPTPGCRRRLGRAILGLPEKTHGHSGKVAIVTGGASGIGAGLARRFAPKARAASWSPT